MRRAAGLALAVLAAGWAISLWVPPASDDRVNDLYVYRSFAAPVIDGQLPYRDVFFEYPPLAAPAIALPGIVGTGEETYRYAFAAWMLIAAAAIVVLCGFLASRTGGDPRPGHAGRGPGAAAHRRHDPHAFRPRAGGHGAGRPRPAGGRPGAHRAWRCSAWP